MARMEARPRRFHRTLLLAAATTIASDALLVTAVLWANFAPGAFWLLLVLAVPLTIGLPSTLGVLVAVSFWEGASLPLFALFASLLGVLLQTAAATLARRMRRRR